jgi:hypothetical protein
MVEEYNILERKEYRPKIYTMYVIYNEMHIIQPNTFLNLQHTRLLEDKYTSVIRAVPRHFLS